MVLEKTVQSPLDCKVIKPINPKGNQSEYSLEGLMMKLKLHVNLHMITEKVPDARKIEGKRRRGAEDEMVR